MWFNIKSHKCSGWPVFFWWISSAKYSADTKIGGMSHVTAALFWHVHQLSMAGLCMLLQFAHSSVMNFWHRHIVLPCRRLAACNQPHGTETGCCHSFCAATKRLFQRMHKTYFFGYGYVQGKQQILDSRDLHPFLFKIWVFRTLIRVLSVHQSWSCPWWTNHLRDIIVPASMIDSSTGTRTVEEKKWTLAFEM